MQMVVSEEHQMWMPIDNREGCMWVLCEWNIGENHQSVLCTKRLQEEEEEEEMRSPGRAPPRHIPMVPAGPPRSAKRPGGGFHPNPSG